jgi:glutaredoxin
MATEESSGSVEIFVKEGCPYCRGLKRKLDHDRTTYVEYDVERDPEALRQMLQLNGGRREVPTIHTADEVLVGYHGH